MGINCLNGRILEACLLTSGLDFWLVLDALYISAAAYLLAISWSSDEVIMRVPNVKRIPIPLEL